MKTREQELICRLLNRVSKTAVPSDAAEDLPLHAESARRDLEWAHETVRDLLVPRRLRLLTDFVMTKVLRSSLPPKRIPAATRLLIKQVQANRAPKHSILPSAAVDFVLPHPPIALGGLHFLGILLSPIQLEVSTLAHGESKQGRTLGTSAKKPAFSALKTLPRQRASMAIAQ